MPDYQNEEINPAFEAMQREQEQDARIEAAIAQQQLEQQVEEQAQTPVPTSTPEPTQEEEDEGPKDIWGRPWPQSQEEIDAESQQIAQDVVTGVGDTVLGIGELVEKVALRGQEGIISAAKEKYEERFPHMTPLRKIVGLVYPMIVGSGWAQAGLKGAKWFQQLPRWKQIATSTAAEIGVEAPILAGSTSATDDNLIKTFNDSFGTSLIGATADEYHPSVNYLLNLAEGATLTSLVGGVELFAAFRGGVIGKPSIEAVANTPEAAEILARNADIDLDAGANLSLIHI